MNSYLRKVILLLFAGFVMASCSNDDDNSKVTQNFVAAFENPSIDFSDINTKEQTVTIVFSEKAPTNGSIQLNYTTNNLLAGEDFTINPPAQNGVITIPVKAGDTQAQFKVSKLNVQSLGEKQVVEFTIFQVNFNGVNGITQGNTKIVVSFSGASSLGGTIKPNVGGSNEPNQVYIDLSSKTAKVVKRDTWDLGFYSGDKFRVALNSSLFMMAKKLNKTDIDKVTEADVKALKDKMQFLVSGSDKYADDPAGDITKTAISAIAENNADNPVYILKLGNEIGTETPETGSVAISGAERGYKKIRILRKDNGYLLQYAAIGSTTHKEIFIAKKPGYNFTFFSFKTGGEVTVEPKKTDWDINFSTATEVLELPASYGGGKSAYGFSDFVLSNRLGGVEVAQVKVDADKTLTYDNFTINDINTVTFKSEATAIGSTWRDVFTHQPTTDIFYIVRDPENNYYKLKFTALTNANGERGYPAFEYKLLN